MPRQARPAGGAELASSTAAAETTTAESVAAGQQGSRGRHRRRSTHPALVLGPALAISAVVAVPAIFGAGAATGTAAAGISAAGRAAAIALPPARADRDLQRHPLSPEASPAGASPATQHAARHARKAVAGKHAATRHHARAHHAAPAWVRPDIGPLTSGYGYRASMGDFHPGIDLGGPYGSPIRAAAAGRIVYAGPASGFGQMIRIAHAGGITTTYGHMSRIIRWSGHVKAGQVIAYEGSEGHSTGPHLHFEVRVHGNLVDPLAFLRRHGVRI